MLWLTFVVLVVAVAWMAYKKAARQQQLQEEKRRKMLQVHNSRTRKIVGCIECGTQLFPVAVHCTSAILSAN
jgi:hypothetical protein